MRTALTIAGSDSIGGAGIQADIKAMTAVGIHATTVITAVTAQNTCKVEEIFPLPPEIIEEQLKAVLEDCNIKAIKTGMLYCAETVKIVAEILEKEEIPLIVDPVMIATVGQPLYDNSLVRALKEELLPLCALITPNKYEAEVLAKMKIENEDDAMFACEIIGKQGSSVLLKGGHMDTNNVVDYFYLSSEFTKIRNPRLGKAGHGSGCVLSAYITANMALGNDIFNSVLMSRDLIQDSIASQYDVGKGQQIVNPTVRGGNDKIKSAVLEAIDVASRELIDMLPQELVSKNGINIAYAMPNAAGPEEIAAVDKRITVHNGMLVKNGQARLGAAEQTSYILLEMMKEDPECRCLMSLNYTREVEDIMEEVGLSMAKIARKGSPSISAMTSKAIKANNGIPDVFVDKEERILRIVGKNPNDVLNKLESVL